MDELQDWAVRHRHHNQQWEVITNYVYLTMSVQHIDLKCEQQTLGVNRMIIAHSVTK